MQAKPMWVRLEPSCNEEVRMYGQYQSCTALALGKTDAPKDTVAAFDRTRLQ